MNKYVIFPGNNGKQLLKPLLEKRGNWTEQDPSDLRVNFIWKPESLSLKELLLVTNFQAKGFPAIIYNHFENHKEMTSKTGLIRNLRNYYTSTEQALMNSYQVHDSIPTSFIITAQCEDLEYQLFISRFNELATFHSNKERIPMKHCAKNVWLIKPANLNQGKGIEICRTLKEIIASLRNKPLNSQWVVQKYIERPFLFNNRKFDIRVWALATAKHELFVYKKGYIRTSSSEYEIDKKDTFIHLTNNCLQQFGENYGVYEKGNTLSLQALDDYLKINYPQYDLTFEKNFEPRMQDLIIDTYLSAKKSLQKGKKKLVYELFGYDFLIDEDFRIWLLEVNTNPYLGIPNEYIEKVLPEMLDDMLEIVLDPHFKPLYSRSRTRNDFELVYCEIGSSFAKDSKSVNKRQPFSVSLYPITALAQVPLCKQCIAHRYDDESAFKVLEKDTLQYIKNLLENNSSHESPEFFNIVHKLMCQIINHENFTIEQNLHNLRAFELILKNATINLFLEKNYMKKIVKLVKKENYPSELKQEMIKCFMIGLENINFRKEIVKIGLIKILVDLLNEKHNETNKINKICVKVLIFLCRNPTKGVFIPGKSREFQLIKEKMIEEGGIIQLISMKDYLKTKTQSQISEIFGKEIKLNDWKRLLSILQESFISQFTFLQYYDEKILNRIEESIKNAIFIKSEELTLKKIENLKKKEKEEQMQKEIQMKNLQIEEEKKIKIEEYINKRLEQIKKEKLDLLNNLKIEKINENKALEEKRLAILIKKQEIDEQKLKNSGKKEKEIIKLEQARKKLQEKNKKKFLGEWLRYKNDLEKSIIKKNTKKKLKNQIQKVLQSLNMKQKASEKSTPDPNHLLPNYFSDYYSKAKSASLSFINMPKFGHRTLPSINSSIHFKEKLKSFSES